ncbi:MAG: 4Fe-4S binding protein [Candidatus Aminicenantes bacterium]|nr:MAG: 4Fe-4S binding protein [Candidatus Aminicenantes bacterium]
MAYYISGDCINCGLCLEECPMDGILEGDERYLIDPDYCTDCGNCVEVCPVDAIQPPG